MAMARMPDPGREVTGGVDTHKDFHVAAAVDQLGKVLATAAFPARRSGYRQLLDWLSSFGPVSRVGVEGTGAWGAGLCRYLTEAEIEVREVVRPNRQHRRRYGKSDVTDAIAAARAVLSGEASGRPRGGTGPVESIRLLRIARRSAIRARTAAANQIHAVIVTSPDEIRRPLLSMPIAKIIGRVDAYRPGDPTDPAQAAQLTLQALAGRYQTLTDEIGHLDSHLQTLVEQTAPPQLLAMCGVGTQTAADLLITTGTNPNRISTETSFAALCGTSPVDASSGRHQRHRLNRGGDRQANAALYRIVIVRLRYHPPTRNYMQRRLQQGLTKPEIIRCLKRYVARDIYNILTHPQPPT
jgi:transposase